jgi:hypothetical protein
LLQRIVRYWEQNKYENCNSMQTKNRFPSVQLCMAKG